MAATDTPRGCHGRRRRAPLDRGRGPSLFRGGRITTGAADRALRAALRRAADAAGAALLLVLRAPSLLAVALALRVEGGGMVLARRRVVGCGGREFALPRFRADPAAPLGRLLLATGIAELPRLLNALRGEMGLVGPAPMTRAALPRLASTRRPRPDAA
jgi:lipopolysaccharide/colanic/teichoic acid biosynthesis glycosyltransferase